MSKVQDILEKLNNNKFIYVTLYVNADDADEMTDNNIKLFSSREKAFNYFSSITDFSIEDLEEEWGSNYLVVGHYNVYYIFKVPVQ